MALNYDLSNIAIHQRSCPIDHQFLIKCFAYYYRPTLYIEYGVSSGDNIAGIAPLCQKCIGVDIIDKPVILNNISNIIYVKSTTRDFGKYIKASNIKYELAFIDADHDSNEAFNDFTDLFENLMDNGIIFLHDTYPTTNEMTVPNLCNDSYKVPERIRKNYGDKADVLTIPICPGLTMVRKRFHLDWMNTEKLKTWVINLSKDKERKDYMETVLKNTRLDYSFFQAVYGNDLKFSRTDGHIVTEKDGIVFVNPVSSKAIGLVNGVIGACISHRLLYKQLIEDKYYDKYLIFEDDIVIKDVEKFEKYLDKLPPSTEYDIAHFEISRNNISHREKPMNNYYNIYQTDDTLAEQNTYEIKSFKIGAFGYVITKRGAINILKKYGYTIAGAPDDFLNIFLNHGGVFIEPSELLIEAREDIPSAIWGDGANSKCIESRKFNRIVIFGGTGMLGRYMVKYFSDKYAVIEINRSTFDIGKISVDEIIKYLNTVICEGDLVLNCAGVINKRADITESEMIKVNSIFPYLLSQVVSEKMAWMVQPTTDCVFSGNKGLYNYSDVKDAKDIYGITKSIGEVNGNRCSVIRCSIIGEEVGNSRSLVEWAKSQRGSKVKGYTNHKWNGITCLQYAKEIDNMIGKGFPKNLIFTSFWVDNEGQKRDCISKYDLLLLLNKIYNLDLEIECHETDISIDRTLSGTEVCVSLNDQIQEMRTFCLI